MGAGLRRGGSRTGGGYRGSLPDIAAKRSIYLTRPTEPSGGSKPGRPKPEPPVSKLAVGVGPLAASKSVIERHKGVLTAAAMRRERQERVVSLLEQANERNREPALRRPKSGPAAVDLGRATPSAAVDLGRAEPPREEAPMRYTEWHLKTVYGIHDFKGAVQAEVEAWKKKRGEKTRGLDGETAGFDDDNAAATSVPYFPHTKPTSTAVISLNPIRVAPRHSAHRPPPAAGPLYHGPYPAAAAR